MTKPTSLQHIEKKHFEAVVIGASAGGVQALFSLLLALPSSTCFAIVVVIHMRRTENFSLPALMQTHCKLPICEVLDKVRLEPGTVYFAPPDYHVLVEQERYLSLSLDAPVNFARPSIDVLFETAAEVYSDKLIGVVLTGTNHDGAFGLHKIWEYGGLALVQTPASAEFPEMPIAAVAQTEVALELSIMDIAETISILSAHTQRFSPREKEKWQ